jgi:hypothetical protein
MRFRQASRRGSASWWGITLCALLFASTYVVFDVLDVDGSQLGRRSARDGTLTATAEEVAGERFFRTTVTAPVSTDLLALSLPRLSLGAPSRDSALKTLLHQRWGHALPRATLAAECARGSSGTADPL